MPRPCFAEASAFAKAMVDKMADKMADKSQGRSGSGFRVSDSEGPFAIIRAIRG
jgi:hypothetical protein